jgi:hypothetical protein
MTLASWATTPHTLTQTRRNSYGPSTTTENDAAFVAVRGRLMVTVSCEGGQYVAVESATGMFGEGDTAPLAIADLATSLYELRAELRAHRAGLALHLLVQLDGLEASLPSR